MVWQRAWPWPREGADRQGHSWSVQGHGEVQRLGPNPPGKHQLLPACSAEARQTLCEAGDRVTELSSFHRVSGSLTAPVL